jgi:hypothetical protein
VAGGERGTNDVDSHPPARTRDEPDLLVTHVLQSFLGLASPLKQAPDGADRPC